MEQKWNPLPRLRHRDGATTVSAGHTHEPKPVRLVYTGCQVMLPDARAKGSHSLNYVHNETPVQPNPLEWIPEHRVGKRVELQSSIGVIPAQLLGPESGQLVVLLHGMAFYNLTEWDTVAAHLVARGYRVRRCLTDMRTGASTLPADSASDLPTF